MKSDDGVGVIEVILILVVLIGLVLIFKKQLTTLVNDIFKTITSFLTYISSHSMRTRYVKVTS